MGGIICHSPLPGFVLLLYLFYNLCLWPNGNHGGIFSYSARVDDNADG